MGIAAVFPVVVEDPRISIKYPTGFTFPSSFLSKPSPVRVIVLDLGQKTVDKHSHPRRSISSTCIFFPQKEKKASKISRRTIFQSPGTEFSRTNALTRVSLTRWKGQEARETGISAWIEGERGLSFPFPDCAALLIEIEIPFHRDRTPSCAENISSIDSVQFKYTVRGSSFFFPFLRHVTFA